MTQTERRVDVAREIGVLSGMIESMDKNLERMARGQEQTNLILNQHLLDDKSHHAKIVEIDIWRVGKNGDGGAEEELRKINNSRYWLYGVASTLSLLGGAAGALAASIFK